MFKDFQPEPPSTGKYLKSGRARKLPIHLCYMSADWEEKGKFPVFVSRKHVTGNITTAVFLIDILCTGVKDAFVFFNQPEEVLLELIDRYQEVGEDMQVFDYNLVHNVIFGALEFAADYGIKPHKDFALTSMVLEKDDDKIPLMEIPLGKGDEPVLLYSDEDPKAEYYLKQLRANAGEGNFTVIYEDRLFDGDNDSIEGDDFEDDEDWPDESEFTEGFESWTVEEWIRFLQDYEQGTTSFLDPIFQYIFDKLEAIPSLMRGDLNDLAISEEIEILFESRPETEALDELKFPEDIDYNELLSTESTPEQMELAIDSLKALIDQYPDYPRLYDYLTVAYLYLEKYDEAEKLNLKLRSRFPDYLFGKIMLSQIYVYQDKDEKVENILGGLTLREILRGRKVVYIDELKALLLLLCKQYLKLSEVSKAYFHFAMMKDVVDEEELEMYDDLFTLLAIHMFGKVNLLIEDLQKDQEELNNAAAILADD